VWSKQQCADDGEAATLKLISEGHDTFCSLMTDRLQCLKTIKQVLADGNFKVCTVVSLFSGCIILYFFQAPINFVVLVYVEVSSNTPHDQWQRSSVVRTSVYGRWTFPDKRLIYG